MICNAAFACCCRPETDQPADFAVTISLTDTWLMMFDKFDSRPGHTQFSRITGSWSILDRQQQLELPYPNVEHLSIADALTIERDALMPMVPVFDGAVEAIATVSSTSLPLDLAAATTSRKCSATPVRTRRRESRTSHVLILEYPSAVTLARIRAAVTLARIRATERL